MENVRNLNIKCRNFEYFRSLPAFPFTLINSVNIITWPHSHPVCRFTGPELALFAKTHGFEDMNGFVIQLPFPVLTNINMKIQVNMNTNSEKICMLQENEILQDVFSFLPHTLVTVLSIYHHVPIGPVQINVDNIDHEKKTIPIFFNYPKNILLPTGDTRYLNTYPGEEQFPIWHVIWAYVRRSDPYTILKTSTNSTGIVSAPLVPQKILDMYLENGKATIGPGKEGLKKLYIQFEEEHPDDVMCIIIKHRVVPLSNTPKFSMELYNDTDTDDDNDENEDE